MRRLSLLPNMITAFGLSCGLFVIYKVMLAGSDQSIFALLQTSSILLLIAAFADLADGAIARLIKAESDFGGEFDSLSDAVTFGVAPPILILKSFSTFGGSRLFNLLLITAAMIYTLCGVLRLVRYNLKRKKPQLPEPKHRRYFVGLPIPAGAAIVLSACLMLNSPELQLWISQQVQVIALILTMIITGFFMVSRIKFPSMSALYFRVPSFNLVIAIGVFVAFILYGILDHFAIVCFFVSWGYLITSWIVTLVRFMSGKKIQADLPQELQESSEEFTDQI